MKSAIGHARSLHVFALVMLLGVIGSVGLPATYAREDVLETQLQTVLVRGTKKYLRAGNKTTPTFIPPTPDPGRGQRPAASMFEITYEGFPSEARTAFQYAADIWARQLTTAVPVKIHAVWSTLDDDILAGAEPHGYAANFANAPQPDTLYPIALANKIAGYDLIADGPDAHDIDIIVNGSRGDWSFETNGRPSQWYDFVTVALHEIGHGLGFSGSMTVEGYVGRWGGNNGFPEIYDRFTVNEAGQSLIDTSLFPNPSNALYDQLVGRVFWNGPNGIAAAEGQRPELWSPGYWSPGSSYAHLSEYAYPTDSDEFNTLMTPYLDREEVIHDPGPITRGILRDIGWTADAVPLPGRPSGYMWILSDLSSSRVPFSNGLIKAFVYNYDGVATTLTVESDGVPVYEVPFTPNAYRMMTVEFHVPNENECERKTITGRLSNADGVSEPFSHPVILDSRLQTSVTIAKPVQRPSNAPAEGPDYGGDARYYPSDTIRVQVPGEPEGCAGLFSFTLVYDAVPQSTLPPDYGEAVASNQVSVDKDIPIFGQPQRPVVPGEYTFHVDLADKLGNRERFPAQNETFRVTIDTTPPVARLDPAPPPPDEAILPGLVGADLRNLRVSDDMYPDQGKNQPYWGYWVLVTPATVLPPPSSEWKRSGVVIQGRVPETLLWRVPEPQPGTPVPEIGYRLWIRVLDGAGNASTAFAPILAPVEDASFVHLPLVQR